MAGNPRSTWLDPAIADYALAHSTAPDEVLRDLTAETKATQGRVAQMQISADHGLLMEMLVRAMGARNALEVGTFTGYSALCTARGLGDDGRLLCCDVNEEWTAIAQRYWKRAGVDHKIALRLGPALDTLSSLPAAEQFDFAFVDADKTNYPNYVEEILPRLRRGGLLLVDNTIWSGRVLDESADDADTAAIRAFNDAVAADSRVQCLLLPFDDGLTFLQKR